MLLLQSCLAVPSAVRGAWLGLYWRARGTTTLGDQKGVEASDQALRREGGEGGRSGGGFLGGGGETRFRERGRGASMGEVSASQTGRELLCFALHVSSPCVIVAASVLCVRGVLFGFDFAGGIWCSSGPVV